MDLNGFRAKLKSGDVGGVYILGGEEDYLVRYYLSALRDAAGVDPSLAVFNNPVFDGEEVDFAAVLEAMKSPPMMSDFKMVEWRHADFSSMRDNELDSLAVLASEAKE